MDVPNVIEKCRHLYSSESADGKSIEVLWNSAMGAKFLRQERKELESVGWCILDTTMKGYKTAYPEPQLTVKLKRNHIHGQIKVNKTISYHHSSSVDWPPRWP
ncbi:hypothetical protein OCU04_008556 [Sclerotinia nivalis]|uniref:Uncharacterized protein n=1 Tax=Sclerotinia nivalis TaxID=352851 RepID=A0A9X0AIA9_9HELO|nr:hypothetical protein OCU04_008556 [Sclerotinia nivalis]